MRATARLISKMYHSKHVIRRSNHRSLDAAGASHDEILADFPALEEEDIHAALSYAAYALEQLPACCFSLHMALPWSSSHK